MPAPVWLLWGLQTIFLVRFLSGRLDVESVPPFLFEVALTYVALWIYGSLVALVAPRNRVLAFALSGGLVAFYSILLLFHWYAGGGFDWRAVWGFRRDLLQPEVRRMLASFLGWRSFAFVGIAVAGAIVFEAAGGYVSRPVAPRRRGLLAVLVGAAALALILAPVPTADELTLSLRALRGHFALQRRIPDSAGLPEYPLVRRPPPAAGPSTPGPRPNVFFVVVESFNANFVESRTGDGREYTPFFNSLIPRGVYVEGFHGNSIESSRGQLALLCSLFPNLSSTFYSYRGIRLNCLPEILRKHGYRTIYDQAALTLSFDGADEFMAANGFDVLRAPPDREEPQRPADAIWGWGLRDDVFFEEAFRYIDSQTRPGDGKDAPRIFGFLTTISSHFPRNAIPISERHLFPNTVDGKSGYANAIHMADGYLRAFFRELESREELRDSLVIVTGDHSTPAGEHGHTDPFLGFQEEQFATPLLILWPGHLEPRRIRGERWSQIDVAPTVLDLLQLEVPNHFLGRSILRGYDRARDRVHLFQPYGNQYIAIIDGNLKYVLNVAEDRELLYDLAQDPHEDHDVIERYRDGPELPMFRRELGRYLLVRNLTLENRIWPPEAATPAN